jgi:hypothetical protein
MWHCYVSFDIIAYLAMCLFDSVMQNFHISYYVNINVLVDVDLAMSKTDITLAESQCSM